MLCCNSRVSLCHRQTWADYGRTTGSDQNIFKSSGRSTYGAVDGIIGRGGTVRVGCPVEFLACAGFATERMGLCSVKMLWTKLTRLQRINVVKTVKTYHPRPATSQSALELAFGGLVPGVCELIMLELLEGCGPGTLTGAAAIAGNTVGG
jgi:hypothetical protein